MSDSTLRTAVSAGLVSGGFLVGGKLLDWYIGRRATKSRITIDEVTAEDNRLESIADRFRALAVAERERAEQIAVERDGVVRNLTEKIDGLVAEMERMKTQIAERDTLISEQAQKIARLEREVNRLKAHERERGEHTETP